MNPKLIGAEDARIREEANRRHALNTNTPKDWEKEFESEFMEYAEENENTLMDSDTDGKTVKSFIAKVEQEAIRRTEDRVADKIAANLGLWELASAELFLTNSGLSDQERNILVATAKGWNDARAEILRQKIDLLASLTHPEEPKP